MMMMMMMMMMIMMMMMVKPSRTNTIPPSSGRESYGTGA
jgi:hypothetical protein